MRDNVVFTIGWTIGAVVFILSAAVSTVWISITSSAVTSANWQVCIEAGRQLVKGVCL